MVVGLMQHRRGDRCFWINLPVGGVSLVLLVVYLPTDRPPHPAVSKIKRIDFLGAGLIILTVIAFLLPVTWGGLTYPWNSGIIIGLLCAGGGLILATAAWQILLERIHREPIISPSLFKMRKLTLIVLANALFGAPYYGLIYYLPSTFQVSHSQSASIAGVELIPMFAGYVGLSLVSGMAANKLGSYTPLISSGYAILTLGSGLAILLARYNINRAADIFITLIIGIGYGLCFQNNMLAAQAIAPPDKVAVASTLTNFANAFGGNIGVAVFVSIEGFMLQPACFLLAIVQTIGLGDQQ